MRTFILSVSLFAIAGCTSPFFSREGATADPVSDTTILSPTLAELTPSAVPLASATTADQFDTTTDAERAEAQVVETSVSEQNLGVTVASLGAPTEPGIWLKTPLVTSVMDGRIDYQGKSINIELRPSGGTGGSGSQISLSAMRLIGAPLTSLPEIAVFAN